jgi:hypothetical protein
MGPSRRKFTKEFKIAARRQLDAGVSIAAVAPSVDSSQSARTSGLGSPHPDLESMDSSTAIFGQENGLNWRCA